VITILSLPFGEFIIVGNKRFYFILKLYYRAVMRALSSCRASLPPSPEYLNVRELEQLGAAKKKKRKV